MEKFFLIGGHGHGDPGAVGNGYKEYERVRAFNKLLAKHLKACGATVKNYNTSTSLSGSTDVYQNSCKGTGMYTLDMKGYVVIESHLNAAADKSAHGCEVLICSGMGADKYDNAINNTLSKYFTKRGIKKRGDLLNMNVAAKRGINYRLVEYCFISNKDDITKFNKEMDIIAKAMAEALTGAKDDSEPVATPSKPAAESKPKPATTSGKLTVDGKWGTDCTKKSQKVMGTTVDGIISNQPKDNEKYLPNCYDISWQFETTASKVGSELIKAIQKLVGAGIDGWFGQESVKCMQKFLKAKGYYDGAIDGSAGPDTVKGWQKYINSQL